MSPFSGLFTVVTGVSGSGKSTLSTTFSTASWRKSSTAPWSRPRAPHLLASSTLTKSSRSIRRPLPHAALESATYTASHPIASFFACSRNSRQRGYRPGRFSFNVKGGRAKPARRRSPPHRNEFLPTYMSPAKFCRTAATIRKPCRSLQDTASTMF